MMKTALYYLYLLSVTLALAHPFHISAEMTTAANYAEVEKIFEDADANTLGIFDIDDVLTYSSDPAFQKANWLENQQFVKCLMKVMTPDQRWLFSNFSHIQANAFAVDPNASAVIKKIQERPIKLIALTASMPGLLGDEYLQEWRYKQLKKLGYDFSGAYPADPSFCMNNLCCYLGRYPVFYNGILMANGEIRLKVGECNKADVLVEFIIRTNWRPRKVIFVDDNKNNLIAVGKALGLYDPDIEFVGVHFTFEPPHQDILPEEFQEHWRRVVSQVNAWESKYPSCCIYQ